jgi:RNA polymerase sigma-70 factor (ECF subfamily)
VERNSDEELLAAHLAGKGGAFGILASRYTNELFGFLLRFVGNTAVADDLVQETFLQVHQASASFDPGRSFKPWLYTIAANKARDYLRSRARRQEHSLDAAGADEDGPSGAELLESLDDDLPQQQDVEETRAAVREQIAKMPDHLRLILVLGYYQQLPYVEISEILGIPVGTVKSRLHAAVAHFARLWQGRLRTATRQ